jgi:hypothetical protein
MQARRSPVRTKFMRFLVFVVQSNRILLVVSTVGLGVAGSKVAADVHDYPWWLLLASFAVCLWLSDVCRQTDDRARELERTAKVPYLRAASDFLRGTASRKVGVAFAVAVTLGAAGAWALLT